MSADFDLGPDPHARYLLEIKSLIVAVFKDARGLRAEREVVEIEEGGRELAVKKLGPYAQGTFTLIDGQSDDNDLWRWQEGSRDGGIFVSSRRSGCVILVDRFGDEKMRWRFRLGAVTEWAGPTEEPPPGKPYEIERMAVTHEGLEAVVR
jgi:phage tail-like protein